MSEKSLKELIEEHFDSDSLQLPVFNQVSLELQKMKGSDSVTMDQIAGAIMKDQSLSSRILRVANSSFYGGLQQVDTVSRAVIRLGMERVTSLAMVASQLLAHTSKSETIADLMSGIWQRAYASAIGCRWVAEHSGHRSRVEEAFLAGLLHDIGELFLLKVMEKLSTNRQNPVGITQPLLEEIMLTLHADMGYRLMLKWELPEQYARVARDHHESEFDEADVLLVITRLLDTTLKKLGVGCEPDPDIVIAATPEAQVLGLKDIKLAELEVMLEDAVKEATALM